LSVAEVSPAQCGEVGTSFPEGSEESLDTEPCVFLAWHDGPHSWAIREQQIEARQAPDADPVNHTSHYTTHPSGIECITVTEHMTFNLGNAVKYIWRAGSKGDQIEDLEKAAWYVQREIARLRHSG
jgi:hypothetical protein